MLTRLAFLDEILKKEGCPYIWAAKGPDKFDCSGLITWAIRECGGPDWRFSNGSSAHLFDKLKPTDDPEPGDLIFYGPPHKVTHVMVYWGDGRCYGATGGDSTTVSVEMANRRGARVRFRAKVKYRPDFRGFRRLPIREE